MLCTLQSMKNLPMCREGETMFGPSSGKFSQKCSTNMRVCPPGHFMEKCPGKEEGHYCKQCQGLTYQPNEVRLGEKCRLKKACDNQLFMTYKDHGSKIRDAECKCISGYHLAQDQRGCRPNKVCMKGYGQGPYGQCENCFKKKMYSDRTDIYQPCKVLTNCEKDSRCTIKRSNGTFDNVCGAKVKDVTKCENATSNGQNGDTEMSAHNMTIMGCAIAGVVVLGIVLVLVLCIYYRRRRQYAQQVVDPLTEDQFKKLMDRIIERSGEDDVYCRKVLSAAFREVEDRIDRQKWGLAQELFRNHYQPAKYEIIVDKYKDKESKFAVNGYLQDWKEFKGENPQAVEHLFQCLKQCGREDIVYEICNKFREGYPEVVIDAETQLQNGVVKKRQPKPTFGQTFVNTIFPCSSCGKANKKSDVEKQEHIETEDRLLKLDCQSKEEEAKASSKEAEINAQDAGAIYRDRPSPSAPVIDETGNVHVIIPFNRAMSYPIQASS